MIYFTFGENPTGVYEGQVIDACTFLNKKFEAGVRLVAFISARNFFGNRRRIKNLMPGSVVLPMFPKIARWRWNAMTLFFLCLLTRERVLICRNLLATNLALAVKRTGWINRVCYDGRGAIAAEWKEYEVVSNPKLLGKVEQLERKAVQESDFRLAVSEKLVEYWRERYDYREEHHVIVPCTLSFHFSGDGQKGRTRQEIRKELGWGGDAVILVYAGSAAGWQSFGLIDDTLRPLLSKNPAVKILFLTKPDQKIEQLENFFPDQVVTRWVKPEEVQAYMTAGDYGLLIREQSVTNRVAAPTKFAEYLASGLSVIISGSLGDYTDFVQKNDCGVVVEPGMDLMELSPLSEAERKHNMDLASKYFTKSSPPVYASYGKLIQAMKG